MEAEFRRMNLVSFVDNVFCEEFCFSLRSPSSSFVIMTQPMADVVISIFVGLGVADILMQLWKSFFPICSGEKLAIIILEIPIKTNY